MLRVLLSVATLGVLVPSVLGQNSFWVNLATLVPEDLEPVVLKNQGLHFGNNSFAEMFPILKVVAKSQQTNTFPDLTLLTPNQLTPEFLKSMGVAISDYNAHDVIPGLKVVASAQAQGHLKDLADVPLEDLTPEILKQNGFHPGTSSLRESLPLFNPFPNQ